MLLILPSWLQRRTAWSGFGPVLRSSRTRGPATPSATSSMRSCMIALLATLCGAETCVDMALFGRAKEPLLRRFLTLPGGVPSHDTFSRLFRLLDPAGLRGLLRPLSARPCRNVVQGVVAVDGKTARRSFDRQQGRAPLHLISAWACRAAPGAGPAAGRRQVERDPGRARAAGPAGAGRLHRHRRRHARPEGHGAGDPRPWR